MLPLDVKFVFNDEAPTKHDYFLRNPCWENVVVLLSFNCWPDKVVCSEVGEGDESDDVPVVEEQVVIVTVCVSVVAFVVDVDVLLKSFKLLQF